VCVSLLEVIWKWMKKDILSRPKLRTYFVIKHSYHTEKCVPLNLCRPEKSVCAQVRSDILPFAAETGHFHSVPKEDRKCLLCELDEGENEMHFIFHCSFYRHLWVQLFPKMSAGCHSLLDMTDECRVQYLFTYSTVVLRYTDIYISEGRLNNKHLSV